MPIARRNPRITHVALGLCRRIAFAEIPAFPHDALAEDHRADEIRGLAIRFGVASFCPTGAPGNFAVRGSLKRRRYPPPDCAVFTAAGLPRPYGIRARHVGTRVPGAKQNGGSVSIPHMPQKHRIRRKRY
jgi:hypothetical protein